MFPMKFLEFSYPIRINRFVVLFIQTCPPSDERARKAIQMSVAVFEENGDCPQDEKQ